MSEPVTWNYNDPNIAPNTITFNNVNSTWVMQITADRKIIVNEDVEVSEAAQAVLNAMQPLLSKAHPAKTLTDEEIIETVKDHFIGAIKLGIVLTNDNLLSFARAILKKASEG